MELDPLVLRHVVHMVPTFDNPDPVEIICTTNEDLAQVLSRLQSYELEYHHPNFVARNARGDLDLVECTDPACPCQEAALSRRYAHVFVHAPTKDRPHPWAQEISSLRDFYVLVMAKSCSIENRLTHMVATELTAPVEPAQPAVLAPAQGAAEGTSHTFRNVSN